MALDYESLKYELEQIKKKDYTLQKENNRLKVELIRANKLLKKKDKQIQSIMNIQLNTIDDKSAIAKLNEVKREMLAICTLTNKVRSLEKSMLEKDEELKLLKSSMKFTLIKELQIEAQTYFNEAKRLKQIIDNMSV